MKKDIIGFWGCPKKELIKQIKLEYPLMEWVDLDIDYGYKETDFAPKAYCTIIKNILNNSFYLKERLIKIIAPIGKDKCDSAFFVSELLKKEGFSILPTSFEDKCPSIENLKLPISKSNLPLKEKIELITKNIIEDKDYSYLSPAKPLFGFWGVPPNDLDILNLFPNETEVFGWCRAVEGGYPGDFELETFVQKDLPTVFFTQAFCSKTLIAKELANKHKGLFIDIDSTPTNSIKAKIEAFIKLR